MCALAVPTIRQHPSSSAYLALARCGRISNLDAYTLPPLAPVPRRCLLSAPPQLEDVDSKSCALPRSPAIQNVYSFCRCGLCPKYAGSLAPGARTLVLEQHRLAVDAGALLVLVSENKDHTAALGGQVGASSTPSGLASPAYRKSKLDSEFLIELRFAYEHSPSYRPSTAAHSYVGSQLR